MSATYFPAAGKGRSPGSRDAGPEAGAPPPPPPVAAEHQPQVQLEENASATERFIAEHVVPQHHQLRRWSSTMTHEKLLQRAAQRKRITIKKITDSNQLFFLSGVVVGGMDGVMTSLVSHQARRISRSKAATKSYLASAEVPTPRGRALLPVHYARAVKYLRFLGKPVTIKPAAGRPSKGISTNVTGEPQLRAAWQEAMAARPVTLESRYLILMEQYFPGLDVRAYVVGDQVVGAVARLPLYVVGDGLTSVGQLADAELARRRPNEYLNHRQPEVTDAFLEPLGLTRLSVLPQGRLQFLTRIADTARGGGIAVDVLDQMGEDLQDLAVDGLWAIPGLGAAAVDMVVPQLGSAEGAVVLEVSAGASIMPFHYPSYGEPRKVNDAVLEEVLERASR